ncbi:uncharacterized protein PGTG_20064 [Puccinia graminis f. sp. tritici CRL 75-36-700-3]|uniref:Uncharacterized protein n=1 Tax=Puccinia graminis f. sp. tritici (strain CRL 75-36-700-3 / race SCCL) TaxID=418459 RepID=E3NX77_PUCGT|nr:uncharacterized protein PGTG_20064 [Puccinia graminis f. sp. tritici CRL 75-36-700-3]EFP94176.1 hypothetical protein PGTG_20064 [Puccinia graminis f. sp. tritici CRL 75-36-700-3]
MVHSQLPAAMTKFVKPAGLFRDWNVTYQFILEGNSSFYRGISYWIFGNQENYPDIKRACLNQLMANCEKYWDRTSGLQWEEFIFLTNEEQIQITRAHMEAVSQELELGFRLDGLVALAEGWNIAFDYIVQDENNVWRAVAAWHHNDQEKWNDIKAIIALI